MPGPLTRNMCDSENVPKTLDGDKVIWGVVSSSALPPRIEKLTHRSLEPFPGSATQNTRHPHDVLPKPRYPSQSRLGVYDLVSVSLSWCGDPCVSSLNKLSTAQRGELYRTYPQLYWLLVGPQISLTMLPSGFLPEGVPPVATSAIPVVPVAPPSPSIASTRALDPSPGKSQTRAFVGEVDSAGPIEVKSERPVYKAFGTHKYPADLIQRAKQRAASIPPTGAVRGLVLGKRAEMDQNQSKMFEQVVAGATGGEAIALDVSNPTKPQETSTRQVPARAAGVRREGSTIVLPRPLCMRTPHTVEPIKRDLRVWLGWQVRKEVRRSGGTSISGLETCTIEHCRLAGCVEERTVWASDSPAEYNTTWSVKWDHPGHFGGGACTSLSLEFNFQTDEESEGTGTRAPLACMLWTFLNPKPCKVIMVLKKRQGSPTDKMLTLKEKQMLGIGMNSQQVKKHWASRKGAA